MVRNNLRPALGEVDTANMWFQQDGATCHASHGTITLLHEKLEWPPRSCDLTPCDFFLWGYVKSKVCVNRPQTILQLKEEIQRVINDINRDVCEKVITNFIDRVTACRESGGGHMPDIIFRT